jgi:hypothetical protein
MDTSSRTWPARIGRLTGGLPLAYAVGGAACAAAAGPFALMRAFPPAPDTDRPSMRGIADGLRYAKGRPDLLGTYLIDTGAMFFGAVLALAVAGGSDMVSGIFRTTMWNQTIPARVRGRLAGLEMISYSTGEPLGNLEAGAVATLTGSVRVVVVSGGILSLLGAIIVPLALPALWRYDARESPAKPEATPEPLPAQS